MLRLIRGLWSLLWLVVFLVGLPAVLVRYVGWPLPDHPPTRDDWQRWAAQPLTRTSIIDTAAIIAWLLWAVLVYAVIIEILARIRPVVGWLRGRQLPPLPTPMQATASGMLGAAVFGMPTGAQPVAAQPVAPASPAQPVAAQSAAAPMLPAAASPAVSAVPPVMDAHPTLGERDPGLNRRGGVALPDGGWVTDHTAQAVASAAAVVWWQRRRGYLPRPPTGAARIDPDLAPLPPTVTTVQDVLRSLERPDDDASDPDDGTGRPAPAKPKPTVAPQTADPASRPIRPGDLPAGGVELTGTGALAAARGILTAVLLSGGPWRHAGEAQLVTTAADLDMLLGPAAADHHATPGLTVTASVDDAIALLEQQIIKRGRLMATQPAAYYPGPPDAGFPPIVVLTRGPSDPAIATRLAVLLTGIHLGVTGALLGGWLHGTTWWVDDDGYTQSADNTAAPAGARLCVLTSTATADLLTLLREARPDGHAMPQPEPPTSQPPPAHGQPRTDIPEPGGASATSRPHVSATHAGTPDDPPAAPAPLRLRLLGAAPTLHRTGEAGGPVPIQRSAALQILVLLAVHRHGASSNQLIAALWPGPRPERAADRLYTPVSKLRVALREAAGADVLVRAGDRYRLDEQHIDVDLWRLRAAVDQAATAVDPAERRRALHTVIAAYTGDLAADTDWAWLAGPGEATRRHVIDAYVALAADEPDPRTALALLQDAVRVDPINEDLQRRAQRAYAQATVCLPPQRPMGRA